MDQQLETKPPLLVKIISGLFIVLSANAFVIGEILIFGFSLILIFPGLFGEPISLIISMIPEFSKILITGIVIGIFCLCLGIFCFFAGLGMWNGHKWARIFGIILGIVFGLVSIIFFIFQVISPEKNMLSLFLLLISFVVNAFYSIYLLVSKSAKNYLNM